MLYCITFDQIHNVMTRFCAKSCTIFHHFNHQGYILQSPDHTANEGRAQLERDLARQAITFINKGQLEDPAKEYVVIRNCGDLETVISDKTLLYEFYSHYNQTTREPTQQLLGLNVAPTLKHDVFHASFESQQTNELTASGLDYWLTNLCEQFTGTFPDGDQYRLPGHLQSFNKLTSIGVQLVGVVTNNPFLYKMLTSEEMISEKEFRSHIIGNGTLNKPLPNQTDVLNLLEQFSNNKKSQSNHAEFVDACKKLLNYRQDGFWYLFIQSLVESFPKPTPLSKITFAFKNVGSKPKATTDTEHDELSLTQQRVMMQGLIETVCKRSTLQSVVYHCLQTASLYLQSEAFPAVGISALSHYLKHLTTNEQQKLLARLPIESSASVPVHSREGLSV